MDVRACKYCKRIFNYLSGPPICQSCKEELEKKFAIVKEYLYKNPGASIQTVAEECEVIREQIMRWLREDRLELAEGSSILLECRGCGCSIRGGQFCDKCRTTLKREVAAALYKPEEEIKRTVRDGDKMRFLSK